MELLPKINHKFDMVFADPPYFLSNNGLSIQSGKIVDLFHCQMLHKIKLLCTYFNKESEKTKDLSRNEDTL